MYYINRNFLQARYPFCSQINTQQYQSKLNNQRKLYFSAFTLLFGWQEGIQRAKKLCIGFFVVTLWLELCMSIAPVVTTTSITLRSNKIQNADILVPANPGPPGQMAVETERYYWNRKSLQARYPFCNPINTQQYQGKLNNQGNLHSKRSSIMDVHTEGGKGYGHGRHHKFLNHVCLFPLPFLPSPSLPSHPYPSLHSLPLLSHPRWRGPIPTYPSPSFPSPPSSPFPGGSHPINQLGVWGSAISSRSGVWGKAPAEKRFGAYLGQKEQLWWQQFLCIS